MPDTAKQFVEMEHAGWAKRADAYDDGFAKITNQTIAPMLDALSDNVSGKSLLDLCTGTGHLAGAAAKRGARVEGSDFVDEMVAIAKKNYPDVPFKSADATKLPYKDGSFDLISCAFGLLHMAEPEKALAEAYRVLKPGGRFVFSVWNGPDKGGDFFVVFMGSLKAHGSLDVDLPPAPPMFKFADEETATNAMNEAGFGDVRVQVVNAVWETAKGEGVLELLNKSAVRGPMLLERQTPEAFEKVRAAMIEAAEKRRDGDRIKIAFPATVVTGTKS